MRHTLLLLALPLLMAACSSDGGEQPSATGAIAFAGNVEDASRAGVESVADLNLFRVIGYEKAGDAILTLFDKTEVHKNSQGNWWYSNTQYWMPGMKYQFFAVASTRDEDAFVTISNPNPASPNDWNNTTKLMSAEVTVSPDGENEVLYARGKDAQGNTIITTPNPLTTCPAAVQMNFKHAMSKVSLQFTDKTPDGYHATITGPAITTPQNGKFALNSTNDDVTWSQLATTTVTLPFTFTTGQTASQPRYVLPGSNSKLSFTVTIYDDADPANPTVFSQKSYTVSPFTTTFLAFKPGNAYLLKVEAPVTDIHFSITLVPWVEDIRNLQVG